MPSIQLTGWLFLEVVLWRLNSLNTLWSIPALREGWRLRVLVMKLTCQVQSPVGKIEHFELAQNTKWCSLLEVLEVSDLVDWKIKLCPGYQPKDISLEQHEDCSFLCLMFQVFCNNQVSKWGVWTMADTRKGHLAQNQSLKVLGGIK